MKIISEYIINDLERRSITFIGFLIVLLSLFFTISMATYSPINYSFNTVSTFIEPKFFFGFMYSTADIIMQIFGKAFYLFNFIILVYGIKIIKKQIPKNLLKRLFFGLMSVVLLSYILTINYTYSGISGYILFCYISPIIIKYKSGIILFNILSSVMCLLCFLYSIESVSAVKELTAFIKQRKNVKKLTESIVPNIEKVTIIKSKKDTTPKFSAGYKFPSINLLEQHEKKKPHQENKLEELKQVLTDFGIKGEVINIKTGPVVTLYEFEPAPGIKSSRIISLSGDIARSMSATSVRIAVVPGKNVLGIEIPNKIRETVFLREMLESSHFNNFKNPLGIILGKNINGDPVIVDLAQMPHLLVAGTTGSGKSVAINTMILSMLYKTTPDECKFIMIDPKMLELSVYDGIPHLLTPVVTDPNKAISALKWSVKEMENRYQAMSKLGVRNIENYNASVQKAAESGDELSRKVQTGFDHSGNPIFEQEILPNKPFPYIVIIVDEMADLMLVAGKEIEIAVQRLAQMARAAGIHLIMATQRPSVDVITGTIKANFPTRISFHVTSKIDSRTILGEHGAEQLLGKGDMLYMSTGGMCTRIHGPFVSDTDVQNVVKFLKSQKSPQYVDEILQETSEDISGGYISGKDEDEDPLYNKALEVIRQEGRASTSFVQRQLKIGYNRAARIVELMEKRGILSEPDHIGRRKIL